MATRRLVCAMLFLAVNAVYWRTVAAGAATTEITIVYWMTAVIWAAKLERYRLRDRSAIRVRLRRAR